MNNESISFLQLFVGPSIIAVFISYFFTNRSEYFKQRRQDTLDAIKNAQDSIKESCNAAISYYSNTEMDKNFGLQTSVMLAESIMRSQLVVLKSQMDYLEIDWSTTDSLIGQLLESITGGAFGSIDFSGDINSCSMITGHGSNLLVSINELKKEEFRKGQSSWLSDLKNREVILTVFYMFFIYFLIYSLLTYVFSLREMENSTPPSAATR